MRKVKLISFSYRDNPTPLADKVYDTRALPNPHNNMALRELNGKHQKVRDFLLRHNEAHVLINNAVERFKSGQKVIAFGCLGGKHRSVALVEVVAEMMLSRNYSVEVVHQNLPK